MDIYNYTSSTGVVMRSGRLSPSANTGVVVQCENGYFDLTELVSYDNKGSQIKRFKSISPGPQASFIRAVRSRKINILELISSKDTYLQHFVTWGIFLIE